jgi:RNA polymerase sigma factor (TIGR02999 family)
MDTSAEVTELLKVWANGNPEGLEALIPSVYEELVRIARRRLRGERTHHTLNTHGLVHEAYERLAALNMVNWEGRSHFFAVVTQIMRHILVDRARARLASKRKGDRVHVSLDDDLEIGEETASLLLDLEEALTRLQTVNPRWAKVISFRFYGGFSAEETARELSISVATANRDWHHAREWLNQVMADGRGAGRTTA